MTASLPNDALNLLIEQHLPRTFPALSICVMRRGEIILQEARGYIDPDTRRIPIRPDTRFDLASVSKLITESAFLVLVDRGLAALNDALVDAIPEFGKRSPRPVGSGQDPHTRNFLPIEAAYRGLQVDPRQVTFKHLLTHSSGLPPWRAVYLLAADQPPPPPTARQAYTSERWQKALAAMLDFDFAGAIGDTVRYTDIGIMLLGEAVARLHGRPLDQALHDLVLAPLRLRSFTFNPVLKSIPRESIAPTEFDDHWRHRRVWGEVHDENACGVGGVAAHAGLFATALDVARFGNAWLHSDPRLEINPSLRALATRESANGQFRLGLGWMLKSQQDSSAGDRFSADAYGHTGFTGTSLWIDPARQLVCAVLTNRVYWGRQPEGIHAFRRAFHDMVAEAVDPI